MESEQTITSTEVVELKDLTEVQKSISDLVEVIKVDQELKQEEKVLTEEEKVLLEEEKKILEQKEVKDIQKQEEFQTQMIQAMQSVSTDQIDYTDQLNAINGQLVAMTEELVSIKEYQNYTSESDHLISVYGLTVIPGCLIVVVLWKIVKAFI